MERGLLSDPKLKAHYDDVVWMYLYQDFSQSKADRAAERVAIRFGITSWPQHFLVDPYSLEVLGSTGRSLDSFRAAVRRASVRRRKGISPDEVAARDALAAELEEKAEEKAATHLAHNRLLHEDVVVRYRAIQRLQATNPEAIAAAAVKLLGTPHDQTRFAVCEVLAKTGCTPAVTRKLEDLVSRPTGSKNPNVLRIRAVQVLAKSGSESSLRIVMPHATSGLYYNGLTRVAIDCILAISKRFPQTKGAAANHLRRGFPLAKPKAAARELRACVSLARYVHKALQETTGKELAFPQAYNTATRAGLVESWARTSRQ